LGSLINIRREILLNNWDLNSARKQTDIALSGLQVSDVLHERLKQLLDIFEKANSELSKAEKNYDILLDMIAKSNHETSEGLTIMESLIASVRNSIEVTENLVCNQIPKVLKPLNRRINVLSAYLGESKTILKDIQAKIDDAFTDYQKQLNLFRNKVKLRLPPKTEKPG